MHKALHNNIRTLLNLQCAASTWMQWQPQYYSTSALTTTVLGGEKSDGLNFQCMGIIRRPFLAKDNGRTLSRTLGYTPNLYENYNGILNQVRTSV